MLVLLDALNSLNTQILYNFIVVLSLSSALFAFLLRGKANSIERVFVYYVFAVGLFELIAWLGPRFFQQSNNLPGLHLYTLVQFVLMALFFNACFKEFSSRIKLKGVIILGVSGILLNSLFIQSIYTYNSYSKTLVELFVIICSLMLLVLFIKDKEHNQEQMKPSVSFVSAVFLQSSVSIIIYMYSNEIMHMKESFQNSIWHLKMLVNYLSLFMILLGLLQILFRNKKVDKSTLISKRNSDGTVKGMFKKPSESYLGKRVHI